MAKTKQKVAILSEASPEFPPFAHGVGAISIHSTSQSSLKRVLNSHSFSLWSVSFTPCYGRNPL